MGEKFGRFMALLVVLFVVVGSVVGIQITATMSTDARALAVGVMAGCLVGLVPLFVVGAVALVVARVAAVRRERQMMQHGPGPYGMGYQQQPPVIVVGGMGGQMPQWGQQYPPQLPRDAWEMGGGERTFNVIE